VKRAQVLLELDKKNSFRGNNKYKPTNEVIAHWCGVSVTTVDKINKQYAEEGLVKTLERKKRETPPVEPIIKGEAEARIIALACGEPPQGYSRWTLRLLESRVVELGIMEKVSDTTIGRMLKKRLSSPTEKSAGAFHPNRMPLS
jgi:hypothetical protein